MSMNVHIISNNTKCNSEIINKLSMLNYLFIKEYTEKISSGERCILVFYKSIFEKNLVVLKNKIKGELNKTIPNLYSDLEIRITY